MKFFCILFILSLFCINHNFATILYEKWYDYYIRELKQILKNGSAAMGIPILDPFLVNTTYSWETPTNSLTVDLKGMLSNFSDFYINRVVINPGLQSSIEIQLTAVNFEGYYNLNGQPMKMVPLKGSGNFELFVGNIILETECKIYGNNRTVQLSNFNFNYDIGVSKITIGGLLEKYHLNNILKQFLSDIVPTILRVLKSEIQHVIDQITLSSGNNWLKGMDPKHIIEAVKTLLVPNMNY